MYRITYETVAKETPIGVMQNRVMCVELDGRKYHHLSGNDFLDMESGEVVQIKIVDWVPQIVDK